MRIQLTFLTGLLLAACGGGGNFDGTATITYKGTDYSPSDGLAYTDDSGLHVVFGTASISCSNVNSGSIPASGTYAQIDVDDATGSYDDASVSVDHIDSSGIDIDGTTGTVDITSIADPVTGTVDMMYTNTDGDVFAVEGDFTVPLCP